MECHRYDDVINRQHPTSKKHPRMSRMNRAAQFAPFAALTGYEESIEETARLTDRRIELSEYEMEELNAKLNFIQEHIKERPEVTITYFQPDERKEGGEYVTVTGRVRRIDEVNGVVVFEGETILDINTITDIKKEGSV
ncbi:MAG: YolD-like family protein [Oscillospiraceae bacterium]|nr:YolD-like family protein [Oscillospiraceae bacterium]